MMEANSTRGFVLPAVVVALVLVGILVTGGSYLARQETRAGMASERARTAFYLAERGATETMARWDTTTFGSLAQWSTATVVDSVDEGSWSVSVTRMSNRQYFLRTTGTATEGQAVYGSASRSLGIVARLMTATLEPKAALTAVDLLRIGGSSYIIGHDSIPPGWEGSCDPPGVSAPGVLIDDEDNISYSGEALELEGNPPVAEDPSLTREDLLQFGDLTWEELVALAEKVYAPGASTITQLGPDSVDIGGAWDCRTTTKNNWNSRRRSCSLFWSVVKYNRSSTNICR